MSVEPLQGARPVLLWGPRRGTVAAWMVARREGLGAEVLGGILTVLHKHVLAIHKLASGSWTHCVWIWKLGTCYFRGGELMGRAEPKLQSSGPREE